MTSQIFDIRLRIICLNPPDLPEYSPVKFGMQDKSQDLLPGQSRADGVFVFECSIKVKGSPHAQPPDFAGPYVHGRIQQRFLYLSLGSRQGDVWHWIRRIKIPLSGVTWEHLESVASTSDILEAAVDGTRSGSVPLLGEGWMVKTST